MKGEIGKGEFKGLIIDRSKMQEEIDSQIEVSAKEFRKLESSGGNQEDGNQFYEGDGMFCRRKENWATPSLEQWKSTMQKQWEDPKRNEEKGQSP